MAGRFDRRSVLRGALGGLSVGVALPALDMFLNGNGNAYADSAKLPVRFGTYFWGLGLTPGRWVPKKIGADYDLPPELESLGALKKKVTVFSGFNTITDGKPNIVHWTGHAGILTGVAASKDKIFDRPSFDTAVADAIGGGTRFRSIELTPFGNERLSYSTRTGASFNTPDATPLAVYKRLFGEGFQDPNSGTWKPDPKIMLQQSVLSAITEQRQALLAGAGASDRAQLDQYFTSVRSMEQQLEVELLEPARAEACRVPKSPGEQPKSGRIDIVNQNNKMMAELMAMALACNQTKVFNVVHTSSTSETYLPGDTSIYHLHTHDESVDPKLGYQVISSKLATLAFSAFPDFLKALDAIREGDGTLLDNTLVMGLSESGYAKIHSVDNIPMMFAGGAGGRHKAGQHIAGNGDPVTRVSLTAQQLIGMPVGEFGVGSMKTSKTITEVMA
ncbi:MAG: DUF1552 domain-containing protein [Alphaproteobacteria bacterium]|nr:DUF1552 domain-containing protein [Alphaproteobacteria bacterium]